MKKNAILVDITKCIGCGACQLACKEKNRLPEGEEQKLSSTAYTVIEEKDGVNVRRLCMHCESPTCASVCPVGAIQKTSYGPVVYTPDKCIGCRYCMQACPFQVPRYEWDNSTPKMQKCNLCYDRIADGLPPACVEACPTGASIFGDRDEILQEARRRIHENPDQYVQYIYGESEVGGTSVLYLSSVPFGSLGFKTDISKEPLPMLTLEALSKIPSVVFAGGVFLYGVWWITNRRKEVRKLEERLKAMEDEEETHQKFKV
ncbi:MAG: 4Fe-4S dicluster domain-containing protein [Bacteroidota bacterium]